MSNFSFFGTPSGNQQRRNPSEGQIKYYLDLCRTKGITAENPHLMSAEEIKFKIDDMRAIVVPSEKQIEAIKNKMATLEEIGVAVELDLFKPLTGGQNGTASKLIEYLIKLEKENSGLMKPTDAQLGVLVRWYFCPDIPFEDYGISRRVQLDEKYWRRHTPDEFAQHVKEHMTKAEASKLIDEYTGAYYTWESTRITQEQIKFIRNLEERFSNTVKARPIERAVSFEGEIYEYSLEKAEKPSLMYNKYDESQLRMLSKDEGQKLIGMMRAELDNKQLYRFGEVADGKESFEPLRHSKHTQAETNESEWTEVQDLIFKLEAVAGYCMPELHASIDEFVVYHEASVWSPAKHAIRNTMLDLIISDYITFEGMVKMVEKNSTARDILLGVGL